MTTKHEVETSHTMLTQLGVMDCRPSHSADPYISSGSKRKEVYDRTRDGRRGNDPHPDSKRSQAKRRKMLKSKAEAEA